MERRAGPGAGSAPAPAPTATGQCTEGGWQTVDAPTSRNQGECVSFVARTRAQ